MFADPHETGCLLFLATCSRAEQIHRNGSHHLGVAVFFSFFTREGRLEVGVSQGRLMSPIPNVPLLRASACGWGEEEEKGGEEGRVRVMTGQCADGLSALAVSACPPSHETF